MKIHHAMLRRLIKFGLLLMLGVSTNASAGLFSHTMSWKEEVLLHDGRKIIVNRKQVHDWSIPHELAARDAPIAEHTATFTIPEANQTVIWRTDFDDRNPEGTSLGLLLLDVMNGTPYLAAYPVGCIAFNKWGRPNPPYVFFKYDGKAWQRISLEEFPVEFKEANVMVGGYNRYNLEENERDASVLTVETIRRVNHRPRRLKEHQTIIREPMEGGDTDCPEMVPFEGGWASPSYVERTIKQRADAERRAGKIPNNPGQTTIPQ